MPQDHPRSRGVYGSNSDPPSLNEGSSPLARGLLDLGDVGGGEARIIPARAGFTRTYGRDTYEGPDHPRSRGVYAHLYRPCRWPRGSSPLARGLHARAALRGPPGGIIPARAGFTTRRTGDHRAQRDHPRSRGVYRGGDDQGAQAAGSSPLARGLLAGPGPGRCGGRIIPARAGFTAASGRGSYSRPDHPRSRGVYSVW